MTEVLSRYRLLVFILLFLMAAALAWFLISRQSENKIPSRGVFVMETLQGAGGAAPGAGRAAPGAGGAVQQAGGGA